MVTAAHPVCVLRGLTHTDTESRAPGWDQSLVTTYRSPWLWRSHEHFPANKRKYFRLWLHVMSRVQCHIQILRMFRLRLSLWTRWRWIMSEQAKYSMNLYRGILSEESSFLLLAPLSPPSDNGRISPLPGPVSPSTLPTPPRFPLAAQESVTRAPSPTSLSWVAQALSPPPAARAMSPSDQAQSGAITGILTSNLPRQSQSLRPSTSRIENNVSPPRPPLRCLQLTSR